MQEPIIKSFLDTDFYQLTMGHFVWERFRNVPVIYGFKNRTSKVRIADHVDISALRDELEHIKTLRLQPDERTFLESLSITKGDKKQPMFSKAYLDFLENIQWCDYDLTIVDGQLDLTFSGPWSTAIYWETPALATINELYYGALLAQLNKDAQDQYGIAAMRRLQDKINILDDRDYIAFCEFGTRRRSSAAFQDFVIAMLNYRLPRYQFRGTSNVYQAFKRNLKPIGTFGHPLYMGMSGIMHDTDATILASHNAVLRHWWDMYGHDLSIALTDTYGSNFFFRDMTLRQAQEWQGLRHDSGDPIVFGEKAIAFYERHVIDPRHKTIVFSDGLTLPTMIQIADHFKDRIKVFFGWGTNLTNDWHFDPLSLVIKLIRANGHDTVKLSDNLAKATGTPEDIERFSRIFGYSVTDYQACTY